MKTPNRAQVTVEKSSIVVCLMNPNTRDRERRDWVEGQSGEGEIAIYPDNVLVNEHSFYDL